MIELVGVHLRVELSQLVVHVRGIGIVLNIVVTMAKERERSSVSRRELKLICKNVNDLCIISITNTTSVYF